MLRSLAGNIFRSVFPVILFALLAAYAECPAKAGDQAAKRLIPMTEGNLLPGGPLAGYDLPVSAQNTGNGPEVQMFPGSVEHWYGYMMKYVPMRSFFDV